MSEPTYIVAVAALIFREGKVLAMRRAAWKDAGAGQWETLSGRLQPGEQPFEAVQRECREECALTVRFDTRPVGASQALRGDQPMVVLYYRADHVAGEVIRSPEHDAHAWMSPEAFSSVTPFAPLAEMVRKAARLPCGSG